MLSLCAELIRRPSLGVRKDDRRTRFVAVNQSEKPLEAIGQLGGHVKAGIEIPQGRHTGKPMALVSALPLHPNDPDDDTL